MKMNQKLLFVLSIIIITFGYITYQSMKLENKFTSFNSSFNTDSIIKELPNIKLKEFKTNKEFDLHKLATSGNNLVIHFWATWCAPCEKEFPELVKLTKLLETKKDVKFLFIAVNDTDIKISKFLKKFKKYNNFSILIDNKNMHQKSFGTFRLPETFLFDKKLNIIKKFVGQQEWTQKHFVDQLNSL